MPFLRLSADPDHARTSQDTRHPPIRFPSSPSEVSLTQRTAPGSSPSLPPYAFTPILPKLPNPTALPSPRLIPPFRDRSHPFASSDRMTKVPRFPDDDGWRVVLPTRDPGPAPRAASARPERPPPPPFPVLWQPDVSSASAPRPPARNEPIAPPSLPETNRYLRRKSFSPNEMNSPPSAHRTAHRPRARRRPPAPVDPRQAGCGEPSGSGRTDPPARPAVPKTAVTLPRSPARNEPIRPRPLRRNEGPSGPQVTAVTRDGSAPPGAPGRAPAGAPAPVRPTIGRPLRCDRGPAPTGKPDKEVLETLASSLYDKRNDPPPRPGRASRPPSCSGPPIANRQPPVIIA